MRIAVRYSDGHYYMYDPSTSSFAAGVDQAKWTRENTLEIPEDEWASYLTHIAQYRIWQDRLSELDNQIYEQREGS